MTSSDFLNIFAATAIALGIVGLLCSIGDAIQGYNELKSTVNNLVVRVKELEDQK